MSVAAFDQELIERRRQGLMHSFGPLVMDALKNPVVIEIMLNDDGKLWIESLGEMAHVGEMAPDDALAVLSQVSSALDGQLSKEDPFVEGELVLLNGERFEGVAPPVSERAMFAIRKKALDLHAGGLLPSQRAELRPGRDPSAGDSLPPQHPRGRRHRLGQDDVLQCHAGRAGSAHARGPHADPRRHA